jgi:hypothetical protein
MESQFKPQGDLEKMLVEKIVVAYWRLKRAHHHEAGLIKKNQDSAADNYYRETNPDTQEKRMTDEQIDAEIAQALKLIEQWQKDKTLFMKMRRYKRDIKEIFGFTDNWSVLHYKGSDGDETPAKMRETLNKAGLTDDDIWWCHIEACDNVIKSYELIIQKYQRDKKASKRAMQAQTKLVSIPEGKDLDQLMKYEGSIEKQFYKAISQLERLQQLHTGAPVPAPVNIDLNVDTE